jgi:hypothetical protein
MIDPCRMSCYGGKEKFICDWTLPKNQKPEIFGGGWDARQNQDSSDNYPRGSTHNIISTIEGAPLAMGGYEDNMKGCEPRLFQAYQQWKNSATWLNRASTISSILAEYIISDIVQLLLEFCSNDGFAMKLDRVNFRVSIGRGRFSLESGLITYGNCYWTYKIVDCWKTGPNGAPACILYFASPDKQHIIICALDIDVLLIGDVGDDVIISPRTYIIDSRGSHIRIYSTSHWKNKYNNRFSPIAVRWEFCDRNIVIIEKGVGQWEEHKYFRISDRLESTDLILTTIY